MGKNDRFSFQGDFSGIYTGGKNALRLEGIDGMNDACLSVPYSTETDAYRFSSLPEFFRGCRLLWLVQEYIHMTQIMKRNVILAVLSPGLLY